jgi:hypothetical protein
MGPHRAPPSPDGGYGFRVQGSRYKVQVNSGFRVQVKGVSFSIFQYISMQEISVCASID